MKGWRAVLPNEKHEFSGGWRTAQKGGSAGCTKDRASGLHIKTGCTLIWAAEKGRLEGCPFLQASPSFATTCCAGPLLCSLPARPSVVCSLPKIHVYHLETRPSGLSGLKLVLSTVSVWACIFSTICDSANPTSGGRLGIRKGFDWKWCWVVCIKSWTTSTCLMLKPLLWNRLAYSS